MTRLGKIGVANEVGNRLAFLVVQLRRTRESRELRLHSTKVQASNNWHITLEKFGKPGVEWIDDIKRVILNWGGMTGLQSN